MKELIIGKQDANQRLDKYLCKVFSGASAGFLYKMLRKKNITVNGKKVQGMEKLCVGDTVQVFFSDETYAKLRGLNENNAQFAYLCTIDSSDLAVVYESDLFLAANKPAGILSQKAKETDVSMNEKILNYLIKKQAVTEESFALFHPSVANRLDRNTTGLILAGKTLSGQQYLSKILKDRSLWKEYHCIVAGELYRPQKLRGYLWKDEAKNRVQLLTTIRPGAKYIETEYRPLAHGEGCTLLGVHLITGRSHQIRAHLAGIGHPVIGDYKYGDFTLNRKYDKLFHVKYQLLHAYRMILPDGTVITADYPPVFQKLVEKMRKVDENYADMEFPGTSRLQSGGVCQPHK